MGQFDEMHTTGTACAVWEAMCPEAVDGTLTPSEQRAFDKHVAGCIHCQQELEAAQRGAAWLQMLKGNAPEPPATLMARILAETTGVQATTVQATNAAVVVPAFVPEPDIWNTPRQTPGFFARFRAKTADVFSVNTATAGFQPRFAMTAAMAFFSLALTMNMMGVRLHDISTASLRPSSLRRTVADASASATRSFSNLRVVYKFESRLSDLRQDSLPQERQSTHRPKSSTPNDQPKQPSTPRGSSELTLPPASRNNDATLQGKV